MWYSMWYSMPDGQIHSLSISCALSWFKPILERAASYCKSRQPSLVGTESSVLYSGKLSARCRVHRGSVASLVHRAWWQYSTVQCRVHLSSVASTVPSAPWQCGKPNHWLALLSPLTTCPQLVSHPPKQQPNKKTWCQGTFSI